MAYGRYLVVRLINALVVLIVVIFVISALFNKVAEDQLKVQIEENVRAATKDPAFARMSETKQKEFIENKREYYIQMYGLDKTYVERVLLRTKGTLTLNFGKSHKLPSPTGSKEVSTIIKEVLPRSILLFTTAGIIYSIIGILVGLKSAQRAGSSLDKGISIFALVPLPQYENFFQYAGGVLYKMFLPLITIVFVSFGGWAYTSRNLVIGILQEDFVRVARAKGVPERKVIYGHVLRAAAPSIVTLTIFTLLGSIGGAIITESVFNWPGMGRLYWTAIQMNEITIIMGLTFVTVFLYLFGMVFADLIYGYLDPRIKVGVSGRM